MPSVAARNMGEGPRETVQMHNLSQERKEKELNNNCDEKFWGGRAANRMVRRLLVALAMLAVSGIASAQDKKDEISFNLLPNSQFVDYLRANHCDEPQVRATVNRGKERGF